MPVQINVNNKQVTTLVPVTRTGFNLAQYSPLNAIGRRLLSASYNIYNAGAYFSVRKDMRKLRKEEPLGQHATIIRDLTNANRRAFTMHERNKPGIIDIYAEQRADLLGDFLGMMYDKLQGPERDQFVAFYTSDFYTNEVGYYTSTITNYLSSSARPELPREEVVSGPKLVTRVPRGGVENFGAQYPYLVRAADPEVVLYTIDSPLLRECYRQLNISFYEWYAQIARELDGGIRNTTRGGVREDATNTPGLPNELFSTKDTKDDKKIYQPTKSILKSMWPLLTQRAEDTVKSGEVPAHLMMQQLLIAARAHQKATSQAIPLTPVSTSFLNFGEMLRSPGQLSMPPSLDTEDISAFLRYLQTAFYNDYNLIARLAAQIETIKATNQSQEQLINTFKKTYATYRKTKVLNRFSFAAGPELVRIFRTLIQVPEDALNNEIALQYAQDTADAPPTPQIQPAYGVPLERFTAPVPAPPIGGGAPAPPAPGPPAPPAPGPPAPPGPPPRPAPPEEPVAPPGGPLLPPPAPPEEEVVEEAEEEGEEAPIGGGAPLGEGAPPAPPAPPAPGPPFPENIQPPRLSVEAAIAALEREGGILREFDDDDIQEIEEP